MFSFNMRRPSSIFWPLSLAGMVIAIGMTKIANFDIWWHLKTGEVISLWHQIPRFDIFSWTAAGNPWMNHEWLFQVLAWNIYNNIGLAVFTVLKLFVTIGIAAAIFKTINILTNSRCAALWGTVISLLAIADRIMARPFLFTLLFLAIFLMQLIRYSAGQKKYLWDLPIITLVWINLHGGGILAPQIVLAFAAGESLQAILGKWFHSEVPDPLDRGRRRHIWLAAALCLTACTINPYGIETLTFPLTHIHMHSILAFTQEWLPALDPRLDDITSQIIFRVILVLTPISYIVGRRSVRLSHLMLTILSGLLIMNGKRFTPYFVLINLPLIFFNFRETAKRVPLTPGAENLRAWGHIFTVMMISFLVLKCGVPATIRGGHIGQLGTGTTGKFAPVEMIEFLDRNRIGGKIFNEMGLGGYLIFSRWPDERVFIDGRTPAYGDNFFTAYTDALRNSRNFEDLDREYEFDCLVFKGDQVWNLRYFHKFLWENPAWRLVYAKSDGFVYLRNKPEFRDMIKRLGLRTNPLMEEMIKDGMTYN